MEEVKKQGMESLFCPYEQALELKELGFKEGCFAFYESLRKIGDSYCFNNYSIWGGIPQNISESDDYHLYITLNELYGYYDNILRAPTWQQAFDWFREKYNLHYIIYKNINIDGYDFCRVTTDGITNKNTYSYEEARLECLKKLIEIVKNDK